jgi:UPF0755 protein
MRISKLWWLIGPVAMVIVAVVVFGVWFNSAINKSAGTSDQTLSITITPGQGVRAIGAQLAEAKLIRAPWQWNLYIILTGKRASILADTYQLSPSQSIRDIARVLTNDQSDGKEVTVKILEGWTAAQIAAELEKQGVIKAAEFLTAVAQSDTRILLPDQRYDFLIDKTAGASIEGFLFPDTYRFFRDASAASVIQKFLDNFNNKFTPEMRQAAKASGRSYYQTVIMASILEMELRTATDRAMAADLFWRRIAADMPMQSDATVNYVTGKSRLQPTIADTQLISPYNTYLNKGLPPGPIGNSSQGALKAAATPQANDYWYYLSAPSGQTIFSKTYNEHVQNKARYLD